MWENYNKYKVMKVFFDNPLPKGIGYQLREISRKIKLAPKSVSIYLRELEKEGLILKGKHRFLNYPIYYANRDSEMFKLYKKLDMITSIKETGLLDYLYDNLMPEVIILFGSASKGEDTAESDVDLFVQGKETKLELKKFESLLNRRISIFFSKDFKSLSRELKSNILNGVILKGYLKVF
jgi:predicted nucleotidyltransferase